MRLQTAEATQLSDDEIQTSVVFAVAFTVFTLLGAVVSIGLSVAFAPDLLGVILSAVFGIGGAIVMLMLILGFRRARQIRATIVNVWQEYHIDESERKQKEIRSVTTIQVLPQTTPTPTQEPFPVNRALKPIEFVKEFDLRDIESLCVAFSLGAGWSEAKLLDKPLPVTKTPLTKTLYYRLIDEVFVASGTIGARGGEGNKTGKLLIPNPDDMLTAIRKLASPPLPPSA